MRTLSNLVIGTAGTIASFSLADWSHIAAIIAGFATAAWMITQIVLAVLRRNKQQ